MLQEVTDYYEYAKLAASAYVDLDTLVGHEFTGRGISDLADDQARIPEALADRMFRGNGGSNSDPWTVQQDGYHSDPTSGFAATLFQNSSGKVLAIRGTETGSEPGQRAEDLYQADLGAIGLLGMALTQAVTMANYILRLTAVKDEDVTQLQIRTSTSRPSDDV